MHCFSRILLCLLFAFCVAITGGALNNEALAAKRNKLNLANWTALTSVDPHATRNLNDVVVLKQIFEPLFSQNELTGEFEPRVAESYTLSDDNLSYIFKIRPNAKFHNGDPVKASDAAFSLMRVKRAVLGTYYGRDIKTAEALDDLTLKVTLHKKSAAAMSNIAHLPIISERVVREQGDTFGTKLNLAGTGPYFMTYLDRAVKWDLEAFPGYYRGQAPIKYIHYRVIPDFSAGVITFESGELDYYMPPITDWEVLDKSGKYNTQLLPANHISFCTINYLRGPLQNDKLREAIAYAIDKEAMNIACFNGHAEIAKFMEKPGINAGAPDDGVYFSYDPKRARRLVIEAGYEKGVHVGKILTFAGNYYEKMAQVLQSSLAEIGITAEVLPMETSAALARMRTQDYEIAINGHYSTGDFENYRRLVHSQAKGSYYVKFEGDKFDYKTFDRLLDESGAELDPVKRKAISKEVNDLIMKTFTFFPIFHRTNPHVWAKGLSAKMYPNYPVLYEWRWEK